MRIDNKLTDIIETVFDTNVLSVHYNYAKKHEFLELEAPVNDRDVQLVPVYTFSTEMGKSEDMNKIRQEKAKELQFHLINLGIDVVVIVN